MPGTYDLTTIAELFKEREPDGQFVYPYLFPNTTVPEIGGRIIYQDNIESIPDLADIMHQDGSNIKSSVIDMDTPVAYTCRRFLESETIPHTRKLIRNDDTVQVAAAIARRFRRMDLYFENAAKTAIDTYCIEAASTATATQCYVTDNKWTMANAESQILPDLTAAWEAFQTQVGRPPTFVWGHPSVIQTVMNAFLMLQDLGDFKPGIANSEEQRMWNTIYGAILKAGSANYKSTASTYSRIWDKRLYLVYGEGFPNYDVGTKTFGQMFTFNDGGQEWWTNEVETEDGSTKVIVSTYKDQSVVDSTCAYMIAGPSGGSYDLV